jgi:hypothetical protein
MSGLDCEICGSMAKTRKALAHHMIMEHPLLVEQSLPEGYDKKQFMVRAEEKMKQYMVRAEDKVKQANDRKERLQHETNERKMKRAAAKMMRTQKRKMKRAAAKMMRTEKKLEQVNAEAAASEANAEEESAFVDNVFALDV